jgi:hypothetical protein
MVEQTHNFPLSPFSSTQLSGSKFTHNVITTAYFYNFSSFQAKTLPIKQVPISPYKLSLAISVLFSISMG